MNADGTHQHRLFHSPRCPPGQLAATWSPDGRRIAFAFGGMYLMDADGRHVQRLIAPFDTDPAWRAIP
jgi:Tol biopolymer transport system component